MVKKIVDRLHNRIVWEGIFWEKAKVMWENLVQLVGFILIGNKGRCRVEGFCFVVISRVKKIFHLFQKKLFLCSHMFECDKTILPYLIK
mgnify:CR=1 FL=1|jgi:hypothetical protein